jgi:hypothetical protein
VGDLRAVLWQWASDGLPLPYAKAPPTVPRRRIHIGPESYCQGSGSFVLRGGGGSQKVVVALLGVHTPSKNPPRFHRYEHTLLVFLVLTFYELRLERVMNFSSGTIVSRHGYSKTIPKRRF